jgi:hypothetical protein
LQAEPAKNIGLAKAKPSKSAIEYQYLKHPQKYCQCKMVYYTGKACREHTAYEGIAFEECEESIEIFQDTA